MEQNTRGKWASRVDRSQLRVEDGHRVGVEGTPGRSGDEGGFQDGARGSSPSRSGDECEGELYNYWVASMAIPVGKWVGFVCFIFSLFFFSVSVKVLPVTPLLSVIFVHRAFCSYFFRIERVVEMRRFLRWTQ